jgi:ABC-type transport system involved in multi-copper enzyme maturation permease subunit
MTGASPVSVTDEAPSQSTGAAIGWWGVRTMAEHEFRLRLRAGRWRWLLAAWFVTLLLLTWGLRAALVATGAAERGVDMFGGLMLFMLALAMLIVPALTAQSINGDRERGVLATLQTTLLTPAEIAIGKLVAAWATTLVFLAVSLPLIVWCLVEGGVSVGRVIGTLIATALLLGALAAIAQCLSALFVRSTTSAVMSYLVVFALSIGTLIAFFIGLMLTTETETVTERIPVWDNGQPQFNEETGQPINVDRWQTAEYEASVQQTEKVWWLLAPNPFAVLADSTSGTVEWERTGFDPLQTIREGVRSARDPDSGWSGVASTEKAVWPYGLAFYLLIGVGALTLTIRQLRTPYGRLPRGVRVA